MKEPTDPVHYFKLFIAFIIFALLIAGWVVSAKGQGFGVIDCDFLSGISVVNTYSKEHEATGKCYVMTSDKEFPWGVKNALGGATLYGHNIKEVIDLANSALPGNGKARAVMLKFIRVENMESGTTPVRRSLENWFSAGKPGGADVKLFPKYFIFGYEDMCSFDDVTKQDILDLE